MDKDHLEEHNRHDLRDTFYIIQHSKLQRNFALAVPNEGNNKHSLYISSIYRIPNDNTCRWWQILITRRIYSLTDLYFLNLPFLHQRKQQSENCNINPDSRDLFKEFEKWVASVEFFTSLYLKLHDSWIYCLRALHTTICQTCDYSLSASPSLNRNSINCIFSQTLGTEHKTTNFASLK